MTRSIRVCYFGTYRSNYSRNQVMIEGLRRCGLEVIECHEQLWQGSNDRIQVASGGWLKPTFWGRVFGCYLRLLIKYKKIGDYDLLIIGYPGQYDVFLARLLSWLRRKPLVWDVFNSLYLIMTERGMARNHRATANLVRRLEWIGCHLPDMLILDTDQFIEWFQHIHSIPFEQFRVVPIGADMNELPTLLKSNNLDVSNKNGIFRVLYYGTFLPNHGVDIIVKAARMLQDDPQIQFELVGAGPTREMTEHLAREYRLNNIVFSDWMNKIDLAMTIERADVCLGGFGDTLQSSLTNNNKVFEAFSLKKPVINGKSPAIPEDLAHGEHLYLCERGSPSALADAIRRLKDDPELCRRLGENGYKILSERYDTLPIGQIYLGCLNDLLLKMRN